MGAYTFFDVETPNRTNAQICQIGVIRTDEQGAEEYRRSFYVDPQTSFDDFNINLHGVSPRHVVGASTLAELWEKELAAVFAGSTLVAHNAKAVDLTILSKDLLRYDYDPLACNYLCTLAMARQRLRLPSYKLPEVSHHYGINLEHHHDALADTAACAGIFWAMVNEFGMPTPSRFIFTGTERKEPTSTELRQHSKTLASLYAVLSGVSADGVLTKGEYEFLQQWWKAHRYLMLDAPFKSAFEVALKEGFTTPGSLDAILGYAASALDTCGASAATAYRNLTLGILDGVRGDGDVSLGEAKALISYLRERPEVFENPDFIDLLKRLETALEDEVLTPSEGDDILHAIDTLVDPLSQCGESGSEVPGVTGEGIEVAAKRFVLTGQFETKSRVEVAQWVAQRGGEVLPNVSSKVDYLVVGGLGSTSWAYGTHGGKIKKALDLQKKGKPIRILSEPELGIC